VTRTIAVLAGGLGTRVQSLTGGTLPKALLHVAGTPFIDHKLREAKRLGATRVVLLLGHGAEQIEHHVGDGGRFGLEVTTVLDGPGLLGTGGALKRAQAALDHRVWVTYGDTLLDADLDAAEAAGRALGCSAVMTVLHNQDRYEPSNVSLDGGRVVAYAKGAPLGTHTHIDYGYLFLPREAFTAVPDRAFDLRTVVDGLIERAELAAFEVTERFHDIGTPEALAETDEWIRRQASWAVYFDRDGVLVEAKVVDGHALATRSVSDFDLLPGAREAVIEARGLGARVFVVTNQPDIARGKLDPHELQKMHEQLRAWIDVDAIVTCPHDDADGCACRKPRPGMLTDLARAWNVDLTRSWMIGDRWVDIAAGAAAGAHTILLDHDYSWRPTTTGAPPTDLAPDHRVRDVAEAVRLVAAMPKN
jgi:histidinol-phosphate phosphatase family protein